MSPSVTRCARGIRASTPVRLSIVVSCTGWQGACPFPCFPSMAPAARRLPSLLQDPGQPSSPALSGTTKALRLPIRVSMVAYLIRFHSPRVPPRSCSPQRSRKVGGPLPGQGAWSFGRPNCRFCIRGREWDLSGLQAIHPVPLLRSRTPVEQTRPRQLRSRRCCPRYPDDEGLGDG